MNLSEYVKRKNGVPIGHPHSLRNNLYRSLGANNFTAFWNFWNPIFGYYLGKKIFRPLKRIFPTAFSVVLTFVLCGFIHDLVTTLIRTEISLFFSIWFFLMGIMVVISKLIKYDLSNKSWLIRSLTNLSIIGICFLATTNLNRLLKFY